jgi:hypothetical protein
MARYATAGGIRKIAQSRQSGKGKARSYQAFRLFSGLANCFIPAARSFEITS